MREHEIIMKLRIILVILFNIFACNVAVDDNPLLVRLPYGLVQGKDIGDYYSFTSIPYAEPPVGDLRFEAPVKYTKKWNAVLDATKEPPICLQYNFLKDGDNKIEGVEDCLTLNVYKPKSTTTTTEEQQKVKFPVVVMIHGGAFMLGSSTVYTVDHVMKSGRVIVVNMNYRLGPLGFLSTEDDVISGNFGLKDQRLALQWIKENIEAFGGDAEKITVIGFSAGGASAHLQMLKEDFSNYAKSAIAMSGVALDPWVVIYKPSKRTKKLAKYLNCANDESSTKIKKCLQSKSATEIVTAISNFLTFTANPFTVFGPVIESANVKDAFMTEPPEQIIRKGKYAKVPLLVSYSTEDGGFNAAELLSKTKNGVPLMEELNKRWLEVVPAKLFVDNILKTESKSEIENYARLLKERYLNNEEFTVDNYKAIQKMHTDVLFKNASELVVQLHGANKDIDVYAFVYDNPPDYGFGNALSGDNDYSFGTVHGDDFYLMFSYASKHDFRDDEKVISDKFIKMVADIAEDNRNVAYGNCKFETNSGKNTELNLMQITKFGCENKILKNFP